MRRYGSGWLAAALTTLLLRSLPTDAAEPIVDCRPVGDARPVCGFRNPEDLVPLPGEEALIVSEYGGVEDGRAGRLVLFGLADDARRVLFAGGRPAVARNGWGDAGCRRPPEAGFSPHGIDLVRRADGRLSLLVVQHGDREAVELFEVLGVGPDWHLEWRGCVTAPSQASLNEVVGLPDGRFYATKMMSVTDDMATIFADPSEPTGRAFAWAPETGWRPIPGSEGLMPNGIETSADGSVIYMNVSGENVIRKIEVASGRELGRAAVPSPDNVTWSPDGRRLLIASLSANDPAEFALCQDLERGACPIGFSIVAVDPESMNTLGAVYTSDGPPMGAGTVGLQVGRELFVGSFAGDRILRVDLGAR